MAVQRGITKRLFFKKETTFAVEATASGSAELRRVAFNLDKSRSSYASQELNSNQQRNNLRLGQISVPGTLAGELSPGTYAPLFGSLLRGAFASGATSGAIITVAAAAGTPGTFTRSSGSWLTDGFKVGDIVTTSGWTTGGLNNNGLYFRITVLTATVMSVLNLIGTASSVVTKVAGDSVTTSVVNKKLLAPASSQLNESYTFEEWFPDLTLSEQSIGVRVASAQIVMPAQGLVTVNFGLTGYDVVTGVAQYFTTPTAVTTTGAFSSAVGSARFFGGGFTGDEATITSLNLQINGDVQGEMTAFSVNTPDLFPGILTVSGSGTLLFAHPNIRDAFYAESSIGLSLWLVGPQATSPDFFKITIPFLKFTDDKKNDVPRALTESFNFEGIFNTAGGTGTTSDATSISIQDSAA